MYYKKDILQHFFEIIIGTGKSLNFSKRDLPTYASVSMLNIIVALPHLFFIVYYAWIGITLLSVINVLSTLCYIVAFLVNRKGKPEIALTVIIAEIMAYCILNAHLLGWDAGVQWYIIPAMIPLYLIIYNTKLRFGLVFCQICVLVYCYWCRNNITPLYSVNLDFTAAFNMFVVVIATIITIKVRDMVNKLHELHYQRNIASLEKDIYLDPLTRLYNRRYGAILFEELMVKEEPGNFCVAMVDIDHFKEINDQFGHAVGDQILVNFSEEMQRYFRETDTIFRWGGEEFLILFSQSDLKDSFQMIDRFRQYIEKINFMTDNGTISFTITAGISYYDPNKSINDIIKNSDVNLYLGKNNGRNKVVI